MGEVKILCAVAGMFLFLTEATAQFEKIPLEWKVGYSAEKSQAPSKYVPAQVPGAGQLDIAKVENYPPYEYADNYKITELNKINYETD